MNDYYKEFEGLDKDDLILKLNEGLLDACAHGNLDKVKYVLTSSELDYHADIHYKKDSPLNLAVFSRQLEIVKYLLTSNDLKEHANIHADTDNAFMVAAYYNHTDIVNYFIFDLNIEKNENIKKELADTPNIEKRINKLFEIRDLSQEIRAEITEEENKVQNKKVKL
jgi:ankyrin repeat protein